MTRAEYLNRPTDDYGYDALGRLRQKEGRTLEYGSSTRPHRPTGVTSVTDAPYWIWYDANGSRESRGLDTYTYDKRNRLVEAQTVGGAVYSIYDYRGQRVAKVANGVVTRYFGDGFEREGNSVNRKYIFAGGQRVAMCEAPASSPQSGGSASLAVEAPVQVRDGALAGWVSAGSLLLLAMVVAGCVFLHNSGD